MVHFFYFPFLIYHVVVKQTVCSSIKTSFLSEDDFEIKSKIYRFNLCLVWFIFSISRCPVHLEILFYFTCNMMEFFIVPRIIQNQNISVWQWDLQNISIEVCSGGARTSSWGATFILFLSVHDKTAATLVPVCSFFIRFWELQSISSNQLTINNVSKCCRLAVFLTVLEQTFSCCLCPLLQLDPEISIWIKCKKCYLWY